MEETTYEVTLTFKQPLLGTTPLNKEVLRSYILSKAPEPLEVRDELETIEETMEKGTTGFHRVEGQPVLYNYILKGFFKDACSSLAKAEGSESAKLRAFRKVIDGLAFIEPRLIPINMVGGIDFLERPLRASTPQGERVALARSEKIAVGSSITFRVVVLGKQISESLLREWFRYGARRGLGQWRNADWGSFSYTMTKIA